MALDLNYKWSTIDFCYYDKTKNEEGLYGLVGNKTIKDIYVSNSGNGWFNILKEERHDVFENKENILKKIHGVKNLENYLKSFLKENDRYYVSYTL